MLRYSLLLAYVCLSASFVALCHGDNIQKGLTSSRLVSSNSLISPDSHDVSIAMADVKNIGSVDNALINLRIENSDERYNKECWLKVRTRLGIRRLGLSSLRRLEGNSDKVVIVWYDELTGIFDRQWRVAATDVTTCHEAHFVLEGLTSIPIVVPSSDGGFHVFLESKKYCGSDSSRCVINFNSNFVLRNYQSRQVFNIHFKWSSLHVEKLSNGNFLARGWKDHETYQIVMIDRLSNRNKELMKLVRADPRLQVVSSDLSVCWVDNPSIDKTVHCSQFNDAGELIFSRDTRFNAAVTPLAVRTESKGEIFLLARKSYCYSEQDCWTLKWAIISQFPLKSYLDIPTTGDENFMCTGDEKNFVINDIWHIGGTSVVRYGYTCKYENRYSYKVKSFRMYSNSDDPKNPSFGCFKNKNGAVFCRDP